MTKQTEYQPPKFIETPTGDLIAPSQVAAVRYWPPSQYTKPRVTLSATSGMIWELYDGLSEKEAIAIRDDMKKRVIAAIEQPVMHQVTESGGKE